MEIPPASDPLARINITSENIGIRVPVTQAIIFLFSWLESNVTCSLMILRLVLAVENYVGGEVYIAEGCQFALTAAMFLL